MTDEPRSQANNAGDPADHSPETTQFPPPATDPSTHAYSQMNQADDFVPVDPPPVGSTASFGSPSEAFGAPPSGQFAAPQVVPQAPGKRNAGKIIGLVSVLLVLVVVIALTSFELYTRHKVKDCISQGFEQFTGAPVDVSLSGKPLLLQAISGEIPFVQVDTEDGADNSATKLHMRLDNLSQDGNASKVGKITGTGSLSFERILQLSKQGQGSTTTTPGGTDTTSSSNGEITNIAGNSADGTVTVGATFVMAIFPIPVSVTVKPEVVDGKINFKVTSATAVVFGIPSDFAQGIVDQMSQSMFDALFDAVKFTSLKVTDTGIDFVVDNENVTLKQNVSSPSGNCSSLF